MAKLQKRKEKLQKSEKERKGKKEGGGATLLFFGVRTREPGVSEIPYLVAI